jgi:hypothetical protein
MRHHAHPIARVDWRFVAWCLFLLLLVSWAALGGLLIYLVRMP